MCAEGEQLCRCTDHNGQTLLHWAASLGNFDLVGRLVSMRANLNMRDLLGRTALDLAAEACNTAAAMLLRAHGGQCSPVSGARRARAAARSGDKAALQCLVELAGVPTDSADETGKSLLHAAAAAGHPAVCLDSTR